ncbi:MAG: DmsE family decaheme c-type cytochrome [Nitrospirota bacterium]|nr:DmsE family decaheme c-type cytochrome [Nitrospirota bacterium]
MAVFRSRPARGIRFYVALGAVLAALLPTASASVAKASPPGDRTASAVCLQCHAGSEPVNALAATPHGVAADPRTPGCVNCHGASASHAASMGQSHPDRLFGRASASPVAERNAACMTCHQGGVRTHWAGSTHDARQVACTSCHRIHSEHDPVRDRVTQSDVCFTCHKEQRAQMRRPSHHPVREGKVACSDCHNPHGTLAPKMLVRDNVNHTCYQCHMEKRGPFVRTHQPVQEDCSICHNPHGSVNANLLKLRSPWLCQQCHEPSSHRGKPGSAGLTSTNANALARGCVNCHTNIHGTNNPSDLATERSLRR